DEVVDELKELRRERDSYHKLYLETLERCRKLELGLLGQKAERLPPNEAQLSLAVLGMMLGRESTAIEEPIGPIVIEEHERRKPTGRKPLPEDLPRVEILMLPEEVE